MLYYDLSFALHVRHFQVGADPGIDHLLAMQCFDEVYTGGGKVEKFVSFCGGLPAPEASGSPLGYKFSWSPRGALMNMLAGGKVIIGCTSDQIECLIPDLERWCPVVMTERRINPMVFLCYAIIVENASNAVDARDEMIDSVFGLVKAEDRHQRELMRRFTDHANSNRLQDDFWMLQIESKWTVKSFPAS